MPRGSNYRPHADRDAHVRAIKALVAHVLALPGGGSIMDIYKREAIDRLLWNLTELDGKYRTRFRSVGALHVDRREDRRLRPPGQRLLRHEHVYTRSWLLTQLLKRPADAETILDLAIGCVVTAEEHRRLTDAREVEGWDRYRVAGVIVYDMAVQPPVVIDAVRALGTSSSLPPSAVTPLVVASSVPFGRSEPDDDETSARHLPLTAAYAFAVEHGLAREIDRIRSMSIVWSKPYTSSVRRGYVIELLKSHGIFDEFKARLWPYGNTRRGEKKTTRYMRLKAEYVASLQGGPVDQ